MAVATDNLVDVLVILPVRLDIAGAKGLSDSVEMLESELGASLNLLTMQVNHLIDTTALILVVENVEFGFLLFQVEPRFETRQVIALLNFVLLGSSSLSKPILELSRFNLLLSFLKWLDSQLVVLFSDWSCLVVDFKEISNQVFGPHVAPVDVLVLIRIAFESTDYHFLNINR